MAGIGATSPLPRVSATVPSQSDLQIFTASSAVGDTRDALTRARAGKTTAIA
jgi:hypothetical protein